MFSFPCHFPNIERWKLPEACTGKCLDHATLLTYYNKILNPSVLSVPPFYKLFPSYLSEGNEMLKNNHISREFDVIGLWTTTDWHRRGWTGCLKPFLAAQVWRKQYYDWSGLYRITYLIIVIDWRAVVWCDVGRDWGHSVSRGWWSSSITGSWRSSVTGRFVTQVTPDQTAVNAGHQTNQTQKS